MDDNPSTSIEKETTTTGPEPPTLEIYQPKWRKETRLFIICRDGSGTVLSIRVDKKAKTIKCKRCHTFVWDEIKGWCDFAVVGHRNMIYIIGGYNKSKRIYSKRVLRYNPQEEQLVEVASLLTGRSKHAAIVFRDTILVTGGEVKKGRILSRSEFYDSSKNTWTGWRSLLQPRANHVSAVLNGTLYVSGGCLGGQTHANVWFYESDRCKNLDADCPIRTPKPIQNHSMVSVGQYLYFIGGVRHDVNRYGDVIRTKMVPTTHSFRPKLGIKDFNKIGESEIREVIEELQCAIAIEEQAQKDRKKKVKIQSDSSGSLEKQVSFVKRKRTKIEDGDIRLSDIISPWDYSLPEMTLPVHSCGSLTLGHKIFIVGGASIQDDNQRDGLLTIQAFDTQTRTWEVLGSLPYEQDGILEKTGNVGVGMATFKRLISIENESPDSDDGSDLPNKWVLW